MMVTEKVAIFLFSKKGNPGLVLTGKRGITGENEPAETIELCNDTKAVNYQPGQGCPGANRTLIGSKGRGLDFISSLRDAKL